MVADVRFSQDTEHGGSERGLMRLWQSADATMKRAYEYLEPNIPMIALCGVFGQPVYFFVWNNLFPQTYESMSLRLVAALVALPFAFLTRWPNSMKAMARPLFYVGILINLPFLFTYLLFRNDFSTIWLMSSLAAMFLAILALDWISLTVIWVSGMVLAYVAYEMSTGLPIAPALYVPYLPVFLFVLVFGTIFNFKTEMLRLERRAAIEALRAEISNVIRGPMRGMKTGVTGIKTYLPQLLDVYREAQERDDVIVRGGQGLPINALAHAADRIENDLDQITAVLDVLLRDQDGAMLARESFERLSMATCLAHTLATYPFANGRERDSIDFLPEGDFQFVGSLPMVRHLLANLVRQCLHDIAEAGGGRVSIRLVPGVNQNRVTITDSGGGLPSATVGRLFEGDGAVGIDAGVVDPSGLVFCRKAAVAMGGRIACRSEIGEFTTFDLILPSAPAASGRADSSSRRERRA